MDAAVELTTPGRARVWRLHTAASALAFEKAQIAAMEPAT
ncbi:hypothetical protein B0I29_108260 [Actinoplanes lutulentus]|uniref:Uncharacterized protein n=1 Tax=Actinoplanes lutulentus TaxID=1287878 RepID=A0A327ZBQ1_9ACTN|nr:hypothetical protein B0I29_108260 [Actinoplanes lutulentus]